MNNNKPTVSIIIPCYNQGKYIEETLKSVLSSTYQNFEVIVVNDGSTDVSTNELLKNLEIPKVEVITTQNQGLATARNTGISFSHGKYILPLDADDKISSGYLKDAVEILENNSKVKVVACEVRFFGSKFGLYNLPDFSLENLLRQNILVASSFFRRADFEKTVGYNKNMLYGYEDWDFWLSLLGDGGDVYRIPHVHFYYRIKRRSMIAKLRKNEKKSDEMTNQIYQNHKDLFLRHNLDPRIKIEYNFFYSLKKLIARKIMQYFRFVN
jgi:glycosyltransferase involved in cell wall biosynthesis